MSKTCKLLDPDSGEVVANATGSSANGSEAVARNSALMQLANDDADIEQNDFILSCE